MAALLDAALFDYGERLLRAGYAWEAHAVWEELWRAAKASAEGNQTPESEALRAFIQLAAAALKHELGNAAGSRKLLAAAARSLHRADRGGRAAERIERRFRELSTACGLAAHG